MLSGVGRLVYNAAAHPVDIDDRTLSHLQIVIMSKLRRGESFMLNLARGTDEGSGRRTLWLNPAVPLGFDFYSDRGHRINRAWLDALMISANSPDGLRILPEPDAS